MAIRTLRLKHITKGQKIKKKKARGSVRKKKCPI